MALQGGCEELQIRCCNSASVHDSAHLCPKPDHQGAGLSFPPGSGLPACGMCAPVLDALALFGDMDAARRRS